MPRRTQSPPANALLHGSLETLILKTLSHGGRHGYGIARWLEEATEGVLRFEEGSLYPALYRMQQRGWIASEWSLSERGRKAKFYRLTERGHEQLEEQVLRWESFVEAITKVLEKEDD